MPRTTLVALGFCFLLSACTQKVVCPAYQSAFIYDKEELRKKYSYFNDDGTPKLASVSKTKYLVAEPTTYKKKNRSLQTVEVKPIQPVVPDSLLMSDSAAISMELDEAARSVIDSTYIVDTDAQADSVAADDSEYVISIDREVRVLKTTYPDSIALNEATGRYELVYVPGVPAKPQYHIKHVGYNVEEGNYLWYLRDVLVLPDVRLAKEAKEEKEAAKEKKGIKGFFSNLFKKKRKDVPADTLQQKVSPDLDEYNYDEFDDSPPVDSTSEAQPVKKKKGLSSLFKRDKPPKQKTQKSKKSETQPEKKEEEDDGF